MKPQPIFDERNLMALWGWLGESSVTSQERKKELRRLSPPNMALFCKFLEKRGLNSVDFITNIFTF